jgi:hypothetical protein
MKAIRSETEAGPHKLVRFSLGGNQLYVAVPKKGYNPKVGVIVSLPSGEAVNIDTSGCVVDDDGTCSGPELDFGLDLYSLEQFHQLVGEFLEAKPWAEDISR